MNVPSFSLEGRVALVTGAAQGIGQALAVGLAHYGASVVVTDAAGDRLDETGSLVMATGQPHLVRRLDVTIGLEIAETIAASIDRFGKIDILVNNAGVRVPKSALDHTDEDWDWLMGIDLRAVFVLSREVGRHMVERRDGRIINIASMMGLIAGPLRAGYCSAKAGVVNLTRALAIEWAPHSVRVNAICPGPITTPQTAERQKLGYSSTGEDIPMKRRATPDELIGAAVFLASDASSYVTGSALVVDGGFTAQ
ncbi:MAG: SDR family oxidoreductase [Chloroflexi bacterium]|nr:SDR family oxidoreductase [Chloroflexota bacterium]